MTEIPLQCKCKGSNWIQYTQCGRSGCASSCICLDLRDLHVEDNVRNVLLPIRYKTLLPWWTIWVCCKVKKELWNEQGKAWKNAKKHTVYEHKLIHDIVSSIHTKTTTDFFSTTDWMDGTDYINKRIYTCCSWTQITLIERIFFYALTGRNPLKIFLRIIGACRLRNIW